MCMERCGGRGGVGVGRGVRAVLIYGLEQCNIGEEEHLVQNKNLKAKTMVFSFVNVN